MKTIARIFYLPFLKVSMACDAVFSRTLKYTDKISFTTSFILIKL